MTLSSDRTLTCLRDELTLKWLANTVFCVLIFLCIRSTLKLELKYFVRNVFMSHLAYKPKASKQLDKRLATVMNIEDYLFHQSACCVLCYSVSWHQTNTMETRNGGKFFKCSRGKPPTLNCAVQWKTTCSRERLITQSDSVRQRLVALLARVSHLSLLLCRWILKLWVLKHIWFSGCLSSSSKKEEKSGLCLKHLI